MGQACNYEVQNSETERKVQKKIQKKQPIIVDIYNRGDYFQFSFTDEPIDKHRADVLVVFIDHSVNISKNKHFWKFPKEARKLEALVEDNRKKAYHEKQKTFPQYVTFDNRTIPNLRYKYFTFIFCQIWDKQAEKFQQNQYEQKQKGYFQQLKNNLSNYFQHLDLSIGSLVITEFTHNLGIRGQIGIGKVIETLISSRIDRPQLITICCFNEQSKLEISRHIKKRAEKKDDGLDGTEKQSIDKSTHN